MESTTWEGFDQLNELVTLLQNYRDMENMELGVPSEKVSPHDVLTLINEDERTFTDMINAARKHPRMFGEQSIGPALTDEMANPDYIDTLRNEWRFLPSDIMLQHSDSAAIKEYFYGTKRYSDLTEVQSNILDALSYKDGDFSADGIFYGYDHDAVRFYNLRQQLIGELQRDNILTDSMVERLQTEATQFTEKWSYNLVDPRGIRPGIGENVPSQRPDWTGADQGGVEMQEMDPLGPDDARWEAPDGGRVVEQKPYWMDNDVMLNDYAETTFIDHFSEDIYLNTPVQKNLANQDMYLRANNIDTDWDTYLEDSNLTNEDFEGLFGIWDERIKPYKFRQYGVDDLQVEPGASDPNFEPDTTQPTGTESYTQQQMEELNNEVDRIWEKYRMGDSSLNPETVMAQELNLDVSRTQRYGALDVNQDLWEQLRTSEIPMYKPLVDRMKQRYADLEEGMLGEAEHVAVEGPSSFQIGDQPVVGDKPVEVGDKPVEVGDQPEMDLMMNQLDAEVDLIWNQYSDVLGGGKLSFTAERMLIDYIGEDDWASMTEQQQSAWKPIMNKLDEKIRLRDNFGLPDVPTDVVHEFKGPTDAEVVPTDTVPAETKGGVQPFRETTPANVTPEETIDFINQYGEKNNIGKEDFKKIISTDAEGNVYLDTESPLLEFNNPARIGALAAIPVALSLCLNSLNFCTISSCVPLENTSCCSSGVKKYHRRNGSY